MVYLWMILNTIMSMDVVFIKALQEKVREFDEKGLIMYVGSNVKTARKEILPIFTRLAEQNHLLKYSKDLVMKGL